MYPGVMSAVVRRTNRRTKPAPPRAGRRALICIGRPRAARHVSDDRVGALGRQRRRGGVSTARDVFGFGDVERAARADGSVVPNLNFSIPASLLEPLFAAADAKKVKDLSLAFEGCLDDDEELRSIWSSTGPRGQAAARVWLASCSLASLRLLERVVYRLVVTSASASASRCSIVRTDDGRWLRSVPRELLSSPPRLARGSRGSEPTPQSQSQKSRFFDTGYLPTAQTPA